MNQSLFVYWTKLDTFWPLSPRESFIILGSQIVPDNNHVVPCHVIICSGQRRRYCMKLEKVDNIGSTNLIITRGSRLQQKENKWWSVFSIFQSSASRVSWGLCFASVFGVLAWDVCLRSPLGSLLLDLCSQVSALGFCFGTILSDLCFQVSALGLCCGSLLWVSTSILYSGSLLLAFPLPGLCFGFFLQTDNSLCIVLLIYVSALGLSFSLCLNSIFSWGLFGVSAWDYFFSFLSDYKIHTKFYLILDSISFNFFSSLI